MSEKYSSEDLLFDSNDNTNTGINDELVLNEEDILFDDTNPNHINTHQTNYTEQKSKGMDDYRIFVSDKDYTWYQDMKNSALNSTYGMYLGATAVTDQLTGGYLGHDHQQVREKKADFYYEYPYDMDSFASNLGSFTLNLLPTAGVSWGARGLQNAGRVTSAAWLQNTYLGTMSYVSAGQGISAANEFELLKQEQDPNYKMPEFTKIATGVGYGLSTLIAERWLLEGFNANLMPDKSLLNRLGKAYLQGDHKNFKQYLRLTIQDMNAIGLINAREEGSEQILHNMVDFFAYDRRISHLWENVLTSYGYGYLAGGILGAPNTIIRMNNDSKLKEIANKDGISIGELSNRIMNIASPEEIKVAEMFEGGVDYLIDKYEEWNKLQPWAQSSEAFQNEKLKLDISSDKLLGNLIGDTKIKDIMDKGEFTLIDREFGVGLSGGNVTIKFHKDMSIDDIKKALTVAAFIHHKAPKYFKTMNGINFYKSWPKPMGESSSTMGFYTAYDTVDPRAGYVNVKLTDDMDLHDRPMEHIVNTLTHEMLHNRDFLKYGREKFEEQFKILTDGPYKGMYSWQNVPWDEYRKVKGEARAFKIGATAGKSFKQFVEALRKQIIEESELSGKKIEDVQLELTQDIMKKLDELWAMYKEKGIPTNAFIEDIHQATGNTSLTSDWLQNQVNKNNVIWDLQLLKSQLRPRFKDMESTEFDIAMTLVEQWAISSASKLTAFGTPTTPNEIISNWLGGLKKGAARGPSVRKDGKIILSGLQNGTFEDLMTSLMPLFLKSTVGDHLKVLEDWAGVKNGKWTKKNYNKLAKGLLRYLRTNKVSNSKQREVFEGLADDVNNLFINLNKSILDGIVMTKDVRQAFTDMVARNDIEADMSSFNRFKNRFNLMEVTWFKDIISYFDVEAPFKYLGASKTGFAIKNYFSHINHNIKIGEKLVGDISALLGHDMKLIRDFILAFETPSKYEKLKSTLNETQQNQMDEALKLFHDFWTNSLKQLKEAGILQDGFVENLKEKIAQQILDIQSQLEEAPTIKASDKSKLVEELDYLNDVFKMLEEDMNYVHIPLHFLLESQLDKIVRKESLESAGKGKSFRELMKQRRKTIKIQDLIDEGIIDYEDISLSKIMLSYIKRFSNDMAIHEIIKSAKEEGLFFYENEESELKNNFAVISTESPVRQFAGGSIHLTLYNYLNEIGKLTNETELNRTFDNVLAAGKMATFAYPLFLPMYDVIQQMMLTNWAKPFSNMKAWVEAIKDCLHYTPEYLEAERLGVRSTPFGNPFQDDMDFYEAAEKNGSMFLYKPIAMIYNSVKRMDFTLSNNVVVQGFKGLYQLAFHTAWTLDGLIRQASYRMLLREGYTPKEAAELAAKFHGDYAGVPAKTRRSLNRIFYTPTFKIAMGKLYLNMVEGLIVSPKHIKNLYLGKNTDDTRKAFKYGTGAVQVFALTQALSMLMKSLGYKEETWGRRYIKEHIENEIGEPQDLVVTFSNPFNIIQRFYERFDKMAQPDADVMIKTVDTWKWEFHPLYRTMQEAMRGIDSGGNPLYLTGANNTTKMWKRVEHVVSSLVKMTGILGNETKTDAQTKYAKQKFHEDFPQALKWMAHVIDVTSFKYLSDTGVIRDKKRLEGELAELEISIKELENIYLENLKISEDIRPAFPMKELYKVLDEWSGTVEELSYIISQHDFVNNLLPAGFDIRQPYKKHRNLLYPYESMDKYLKTGNQTMELLQNPQGDSFRKPATSSEEFDPSDILFDTNDL